MWKNWKLKFEPFQFCCSLTTFHRRIWLKDWKKLCPAITTRLSQDLMFSFALPQLQGSFSSSFCMKFLATSFYHSLNGFLWMFLSTVRLFYEMTVYLDDSRQFDDEWLVEKLWVFIHMINQLCHALSQLQIVPLSTEVGFQTGASTLDFISSNHLHVLLFQDKGDTPEGCWWGCQALQFQWLLYWLPN